MITRFLEDRVNIFDMEGYYNFEDNEVINIKNKEYYIVRKEIYLNDEEQICSYEVLEVEE